MYNRAFWIADYCGFSEYSSHSFLVTPATYIPSRPPRKNTLVDYCAKRIDHNSGSFIFALRAYLPIGHSHAFDSGNFESKKADYCVSIFPFCLVLFLSSRWWWDRVAITYCEFSFSNSRVVNKKAQRLATNKFTVRGVVHVIMCTYNMFRYRTNKCARVHTYTAFSAFLNSDHSYLYNTTTRHGHNDGRKEGRKEGTNERTYINRYYNTR